MSFDYDSKLRTERLPTQWCPGCGNGMVLKAIIRAITKLGWDMNDVCVVSGIGCSGRMSSYIKCNTVHPTHGRAIPVATGIKLANPEKHVIVISGDGDGLAIGGNHFIHACRRNIGIKYIVINNFIYGLTNSQASPTTPQGMWAVTQQFGAIDPVFDSCNLAIGAGAAFVARGTAIDLLPLEKVFVASFAHEGFSFVEVFSGCPVNFGRKNGMGTPEKIEKWIGSIALPKAKHDALPEEEREGKFPVGILKESASKKEYCAAYAELVEKICSLPEPIPAEKSEVFEKKEISKTQIRFVGAGGQGSILAGEVLMRAAIAEGNHAVTKPTYTSQVRGGPTLSDIIIDDAPICYPCTIPGEIDFMLATAGPAFHRFKDGIKKGAVIVIDPNLVTPTADDVKTWKFVRIPIVEIANETGVPQTQSAVALGIAVRVLGCVSERAALQSLLSETPAKYAEVNKKAFELGLECAGEALAVLENEKE